MKPFIEIKKPRNLDAIIEDSFKFFRLHIKEMLKIVWEQNRILLTLLIITYAISSYYSFGVLDDLGNILRGRVNSININNSVLKDTVSIASAVLSIIFFPRFFAAIAGYMKVYDKNKGQVDPEEIKQIVKDKFWGLLGLSFTLGAIFVLIYLFAALIFKGLALMGPAGKFLNLALVIPLFLFSIVYLSLVFYVYFFDNIDISAAISRTFSYIKERFWFSLGVILLMIIIVFLIILAINIPIEVYIFLKTLALYSDNSAVTTGGQTGDIIIALYSIVSYIAELILRVLTMISMVFLFFSLKEYHTNESMFDKIDQIGDDDANSEI